MPTDDFLVAGSGSYTVSASVFSLTVGVWGGGGGGGGNTTTADGGGGGGGGAYAESTFAVTPGQVFTFYVAQSGSGVAGANGTSGQSSWFSSSAFLFVEGGISGSTPAGGATINRNGRGGLVANSIGDIKFSGGGGGIGRDNATGRGGGGGSSAGTAANGVNGTAGGGAATNAAGGTAPTGGGDCGNGGNASQDGSPGLQPGGGGGGSGDNVTRTGGAGAVGKVAVTFTQGATIFIPWIG
jgi:hypothetical protein